MTDSTPDSADASNSSYQDELADKVRRRPHRKSRFGCKNCKVRRVKCDESKPVCSNCRNRRLDCDFASAPTRSSSLPPGTDPVASSVEASSASNAIGLAEIELTYYWTTSTAKTLSVQDAAALFWQTGVTEMGLTHPHVLHLIFAITALHLARCRPTRHGEYVAKANQHYAKALPMVTAELAHINKQNCDAVFLSVELISLIGWARGPQPGEFLAFGTNQRSEWLVMFRGIRTTMESLDYDAFTKSYTVQMRAKGKALQHITRPAFEQPLADLRDYVQRASLPNHLASNILALDVLLECYENRYNGIDNEYHLAFGWLFRMDEDFLEAMQRHEAVPLVLYAYFMVLVNDMECFWYMKGWTTHVLSGIWEAIADEERIELRWPMGAVGWIPPIC